jgi:DNA polymerase elongation subunit (family B)
MYSQEELTKIVFFDLETASGFASLDELTDSNPRMAELWSKRCEYLRSKFEENKDKTDEELYLNKAALHPEFNRIVCMSVGRLAFEGNFPKIILKSYCDSSEEEILDGIVKVFNGFSKYKFCGHNIKRFDIPVICKRLLINGISLPDGLKIHNLKPWEMPFVDTSELWSFGAWQEGFASLDLLSASLNIDSPKDDIRGEEVSSIFWKEGDLNRISTYCEKDVKTVAQVLLNLSGLPQLD